MTDNEIIKALELCLAEKITKQTCGKCPYHQFGKLCKVERSKDALDLINRQKAEIERLHKLQKPTETSGFKIVNGKVVFYTNILNGYRHEYKDHEEVVKELNLMLQSCYKCDDVVSHYKGKLNKAKSEAMSEFAERLKLNFDKAINGIPRTSKAFSLRRDILHDTHLIIDHVKKEMAGDGDA